MQTANPRWIALQAIMRVLDQGRSLDDVFNSEWFQALDAPARDLAFARELVFGVCRWYFALSALLETRLQKPLRERDRDVEAALLIGLYQLLIIKTEAHAAVNETVKLAQALKKPWARGLINAVLRKLIRDQVGFGQAAEAQAYPQWMRARIEADWGPQSAALLQAGNQRAPMVLRVDTRQLDIELAQARLVQAGIECRRHAQVASALELDSACDVAQIPGFDSGQFSVQDAAAQLAAELLECDAGARVLDACAAPGGKTVHLLQRYDGIRLDALDNSESRMQRVTQNLQRVGKTAELRVADAGESQAWFDGEAYDCILADVPCSASGVLRRHPDIKLLRRESDIMPLLEQQAKILDALWRLLKPGGKMLYSTCSIFKDENEAQVASFLQRHVDARELVLQDADWGEKRPQGRQILTGSENMDGFYYALLRKQDSA